MKSAALIGLTVCLSGCGTFLDVMSGEKRSLGEPPGLRVYGGFRTDLEVIRKDDGWGHPDFSSVCKPTFTIDVPLSLAFDTAMLPVTATVALIRLCTAE